MFQSIFKAALFCGLFATLAMFTNSANAQSGSRIFGGGGSGSRLAAPAQSFAPTLTRLLSHAPAQSYAPAQSFTSGSGSRSLPTQSFAPTSTYQPAAPMPVQSYSQAVPQSYSQPQSYGQPVVSSGCSSCGGSSYTPMNTTSYAPAPVYSQPVYTPSNYNPGTIYRPLQSGGGCGCR